MCEFQHFTCGQEVREYFWSRRLNARESACVLNRYFILLCFFMVVKLSPDRVSNVLSNSIYRIIIIAVESDGNTAISFFQVQFFFWRHGMWISLRMLIVKEYNQSIDFSTHLRVCMWCIIHYTAKYWILTINNGSKLVHDSTNQELHDFDGNLHFLFQSVHRFVKNVGDGREWT